VALTNAFHRQSINIAGYATLRSISCPAPHLSRIPRPVRRAVRRVAGTSSPCRASSAMPSTLYEEHQTPNHSVVNCNHAPAQQSVPHGFPAQIRGVFSGYLLARQDPVPPSGYLPWSRLVKAVFGDAPGARACHLGDSSTNGTLSATVLRQCWARKVGSVPQDCPGAGMSRELPRCPNNRRPVRADVSSAHIMMWCFRWLRDAQRICASAMLIGHLHDTAFQ
jgi:hypothetical protein